MLNLGEAELLGAIVGDGFIYTKHKKYVIGLTGNPKTDSDYFLYLKKLIVSSWNKTPALFFRSKGVRILFSSKETVLKLFSVCDFAFGEGKCERARIPQEVINDKKLCSRFVRGLFDTDGSVFSANKPGAPNYPSIEFTTASKELAFQVKDFLQNSGFKVAKIWSCKSKLSKRIVYKVPLNGKDNLKMWLERIGFSNPYKFNKAISLSG